VRTVFLDTVGLLAVWDVTDQWHAAAEPVFQSLIKDRVRLVTTSLVLYECGNAAARKPYRVVVGDVFRQELQQFGDLLEPRAAEVDQAWDEFTRGAIGSAGIIDHLSFIVMRRLGINEAFTNDRHFPTGGFTTLF
jgi:predicted nucleic acid-binding protein